MIPGKTEVALIQIRQGDKADLRQLEEGQFGYALDTGEIFLGAPNEGRLAGREFRNLKILTELNGVSSSNVSMVDVTLQAGTDNGTMKLIKSFSTGEDVTIDNIPVKNVLTTDDISRFVGVEAIYNLAIAADDTTTDKIPSLYSINLTLDNRLQYYIRNDAKTSSIIAVGTTDGDSVTTPIAVDRTITDRLANYITTSTVPQVVSDITMQSPATDSITLLYSILYTATGNSQTNSLVFPSASATSAGLITASDYATIQEYDTRITRLEASGVWRGSYERMADLPTSRTDPSLAGGYADANDFVTVINGMDPNGETGQAVFRLREFDETTGAIPAENFDIQQTTGSSLSDLDVVTMTFKRRTGVDFDTTFTYKYSPIYNYVFSGIYTDPDTSISYPGTGYIVGDIVECDNDIQLEVTQVDANNGIVDATILTTTGTINHVSDFDTGRVWDVTTTNRHRRQDDDDYRAGDFEPAVVNVSSVDSGSSVWVDEDYHEVDLSLYGISYTGTPVNGDVITLTYTASGWGFDYWISINIAIATEYKTGVVLSSPDINKVSVGLDGTMTVNSYAGHEQRITANTNALTEKVPIFQGVTNEGKTLIVDNSGNLTLTNQGLNDGIWDYTAGEFITQSSPIEDWNTLPSGIYNLTTDSNTLHSLPGDIGGDYHVTTTTYNGKTIQIAVDMSNPMKQYVRTYDGTTWSTWNYPYASWVPGNS